MAICHALKSEVAYEMNEMSVAQSLLDDAMVSIEGIGRLARCSGSNLSGSRPPGIRQGRLARRFDRACPCGYRGARAQHATPSAPYVRRTHSCLDPQ